MKDIEHWLPAGCFFTYTHTEADTVEASAGRPRLNQQKYHNND